MKAGRKEEGKESREGEGKECVKGEDRLLHLPSLSQESCGTQINAVRGLDLSTREQVTILPDHGTVCPKYRYVPGSLIQRGHSILDLSYTPAKMCCRDFRARFITLAGF